MNLMTEAQRAARVITMDRKEVAIGDLLGQPLVLSFFPAAFTSVCTGQVCGLRDGMTRLNDIDARVYGVSIDLPMTLKVFAEMNGLNFPLLSDCNREAIRAFDVVLPLLSGVVRDVANRAVIVASAGGGLAYRWVAEQPTLQIPFDAIYQAVEAARTPTNSL